MRKALGLTGLLVGILVFASLWEYFDHGTVRLMTRGNIRNLLPWIGLFGILSLGQAVVIITGGIDLSIGSVVALVGVVCAILLREWGLHPVVVLPICLAMCAAIGVWHGLLVTQVRMQPFVVTLCGLFFFRGIARLVTGDSTRGFGQDYPGLKWLGSGYIPGGHSSIVSVPFLIFLVLAVWLGAYLHFTAPGRHIFAIGANEEGARFSGIRVARLKIWAYVLCSLLSGVGGLLIAFNINSLSAASFGSFYELYAIAGAVLGGCSLRGGSGNVLGIVIGASLIVVLKNLVNILEIPSELEYVVIGGAILFGVLVDELIVRRAAARPASQ